MGLQVGVDKSKLLAADMHLIFHLCLVAVAGDVLVHNHLRSLVNVAYIDFECDKSQGNSFVAYFQHHGSAKLASMLLTTKYYLMSELNPSLYCTFYK